MSHHQRNRDQEKFEEDIRARQQNIIWPDTVRNARSIDEYFWRGAENASLVQRIAAWLFGVAFIGLGLMFLWLAHREGSFLGIAVSVVLLALGARIFFNGCRRRPSKERLP
jgi:lipopolysaccharide export LptBFGC system permease protein LptF